MIGGVVASRGCPCVVIHGCSVAVARAATAYYPKGRSIVIRYVPNQMLFNYCVSYMFSNSGDFQDFQEL